MILTSTRITLRCLGALVESWEHNLRVSRKEIHEYGGFPDRSITPNLVKMVKAGVLNSIAGGSNRGYILSKDPRDINMAELLEIFEGKIHFRCCNDILNIGIRCENSRESCAVYQTVNQAVIEVLGKLSEVSLYEYVKSCSKDKAELFCH